MHAYSLIHMHKTIGVICSDVFYITMQKRKRVWRGEGEAFLSFLFFFGCMWVGGQAGVFHFFCFCFSFLWEWVFSWGLCVCLWACARAFLLSLPHPPSAPKKKTNKNKTKEIENPPHMFSCKFKHPSVLFPLLKRFFFFVFAQLSFLNCVVGLLQIICWHLLLCKHQTHPHPPFPLFFFLLSSSVSFSSSSLRSTHMQYLFLT